MTHPWDAATAGLQPPFAVVDLEALDAKLRSRTSAQRGIGWIRCAALETHTRSACSVPDRRARVDAMTRRVPFRADEKTSLVAALDRHRDAILWKLEGLDDDQLRWPGVPSGTTLLGLVKHLAFVENSWFCETFGEPFEAPSFDESDPEADLRIEADETTDDVLAYYRRARAAADASIAKHALEDSGTAWFGDTVTMRWVLIHMVQEVSRHAGHADIVRELIDGSTGDHDRRSTAS